MIGDIKLSLKNSLIIILVAGLIIGTVFVFGMSFWNATVTRDDCISVEATYESYKITYSDGLPQEIIVNFQDYEQQIIDGVIIDETLISKLDNIETDSKVFLLIHPNSNTILEFITTGESIVEFENAMSNLNSERKAFVVIGSFLYVGAFASAIKLITMRKKK